MTRPDLEALEKLAESLATLDSEERDWPLVKIHGRMFHVENAAKAASDGLTALIAELKEARGLLSILDDHLGDDDGMWSDESTISTEWIGSDGVRRSLTFGLFRRIRAFLARNGKGEG